VILQGVMRFEVEKIVAPSRSCAPGARELPDPTTSTTSSSTRW
jgi:hypothetical protein